MKPRVFIYRSDLLPPSETFILAQAAALRRYTATFLGLRRLSPDLSEGRPALLFTRFPRLRRLLALSLGLAPGLVRSARKRSAALLHAHFALDAAEALPLVRALQLPLVVTLHGYDVMRTDEAHALTRRGRRYLARRARLWDRASLFLCVSESVRRVASARGFPEEKLRVLPIGVEVLPVASPHPLPSDPTILFIGRLMPKKGCRVLIEAMVRVQAEIPRARLLIAGDGPERDGLQTLARRLFAGLPGPVVQFLGMQTREQLRERLATVRCLAAPSLTGPDGDAEGLPTVLGEALAAGVPVASTLHSGIPELIAHGQHGLLSPEGDAASLARHLIALCRDDALAERLRRSGRRRVMEQFDIRRQTCQLEKFYDEAIANFRSASVPPDSSARAATAPTRLRTQAAWLLSGNGAAMLFQAVAFLLAGRMLGAHAYGAFAGAVALINVLSQFSGLGMDMVLLRTVSRDPFAFATTWFRALVIATSGFALLLGVSITCGRFFLPTPLAELLPWLACSDALFGRITQMASRALQASGHIRWSARLPAATNAARACAAGVLCAAALRSGVTTTLSIWVRFYTAASLVVAIAALCVVTRILGPPRRAAVRPAHLLEGLSFSFSSSAISTYNDIDKTLLVEHGMMAAAGAYAAAYRIVDVASAPLYSLFGAVSPALFRDGAAGGVAAARRSITRLLRWTVPLSVAVAGVLYLAAPLLPIAFGRSFAGAVDALRWLCLIPLLRSLHYAWGTAITACASQWRRTAAQAGIAAFNLGLNLWLIPRWGWHGAALASLLSDGGLALACFLILRALPRAGSRRRRLDVAAHRPGTLSAR
jgi:glycosyltransferase involved in cell wall biosynthesis/O-antigen/teichoic acid export membrane protein